MHSGYCKMYEMKQTKQKSLGKLLLKYLFYEHRAKTSFTPEHNLTAQ